ncbi:MAG: rhodanese-like domain-containing protein [Bacteroidales bacterium]|nr:rhodanese-like domain-containing protein [Bacteroidales bacterium]
MKKYFLMIIGLLTGLLANSQEVKKILAKDTLKIINNRDITKTIMIDGRSAEMFSEKHIEGAIHIDAFQYSITTKLKKHLSSKQIIVYCTNHRRAELITEKPEELKYKGEIIFIIDSING